jgi:type IV pilus assembly protein PilB
VLNINADVRGMILAGVSADRIQKVALDSGMVTLRMSGMRKVAQGITTVEEVLSVVADQE